MFKLVYFKFVELDWMMTVDLLTLQQKQYISIPGQHKNFKINCKGPIPPKMSHIYITSHLEEHRHMFTSKILKFCHSQRYMYCLKFLTNNAEYIVYGNNSAYHSNVYIDQKIYFSWDKSNSFYKGIGYELPYFMKRDELDKFIRLLHGEDKIPYLEAIFIGLTHNDELVSFLSYQIKETIGSS